MAGDQSKGWGLTQQPTDNQVREPDSLVLAPETACRQSSSNSGPLGLFGGRFDPVHWAHLRIAQTVADQLGLPEVRWIVTGDPVHKSAEASAQDRLAMVKLALDELADPRMQADDREIVAAVKTGKPSYTVNTVAAIKAEQPGRTLIWILGEDQLQKFQTWHRWEWLAKNMSLAVCARPEAFSAASLERIQDLGGLIYWIKSQPNCVSSTQIRKALFDQNLPNNTLPDSVKKYIFEHNLYQTSAK